MFIMMLQKTLIPHERIQPLFIRAPICKKGLPDLPACREPPVFTTADGYSPHLTDMTDTPEIRAVARPGGRAVGTHMPPPTTVAKAGGSLTSARS